MANSNTFQILHISDLHIKDDKKEKFDRKVVLDPLIAKVKGDLKDGFSPEIIVVTGDIAFKGLRSEYGLAKIFFDDLLLALKLPSERLFIVPGNHDVNRKKYRPKDIPVYDNMPELNQELEDEAYRADLLKGMTDYFDFIQTHYSHLKSDHGSLVPFVYDFVAKCGKKIGIVGLNSAWMCRRSPDERTIAIGEYQIVKAIESLDKKGEKNLRISMFHHPLFWLWPVDRKICRKYLDNYVILCGHLHDAGGGYLDDLEGNVFNFQAGGAYLGSESIWPSRFQYLTFDWDKQTILLDFRKFAKDRREWVLDAETGHNGQRLFILPGPGKEMGDADATFREIPETYYGWIRDHCSYMDVENLQVDGKAVRVRLPEIFIPLYAHDHGKKESEEKVHMDKKAPIDVEALMEKYGHLLLEGDAGSGKTTVLKHFAHSLISENRLNGDASKLQDCLPVLIFLKDLKGLFVKNANSASRVLTVESLLSDYFKSIENVLDFETVKGFCRAKRTVFLLDGLDEITPEQRTLVVNAFANFKNRYPGNKFVFSGRPHGLVEAAADKFGSNHVRILPLVMKQVESFIRKWFQYMYLESTGLAGKTADAMISEIKEHKAVEKLIENPLMLTAICILYYGGKELPGQRAELYKKFVNNLLHRRFDEPENIRDFLSTLAFRMHELGVRGVDKVLAVENL
jgi:predicted MPP superfamily phosphohydrolase